MSTLEPRFGVLILQDVPWATLLERVQRAEEMGFDTAWIADHYVNPYAPAAGWFDGWTALAALAARTSSVRLGPLVASITLRNPALLARMAMTVDHISAGRLELAIGAGGAPLDFSMLGLPVWPPRERTDRLAEGLHVVSSLLESGQVRHAGTYYPIDEALLAPLPIQRPRPPVTVAALGPRAIALAARHGDGWSTYGVATGRAATGRLDHDAALAVTARRAQILDAACDAVGRERSSVRRSYLSFRGILEPLGSPTEFAAAVKDFRAIGMSEFVVYWPPDPADEPALEAIARFALPDLRG